MTASSSIGLSEQVEYTILPPTANCSTPRTAIRSWSLENTHNYYHIVEIGRKHVPLLFSHCIKPL